MVPVGVTAVFSGVTGQHKVEGREGAGPFQPSEVSGERLCQKDNLEHPPIVLLSLVPWWQRKCLETVDATDALGGLVF